VSLDRRDDGSATATWRAWLPGVDQVTKYERTDLAGDVVAGVVLTAFLVPVGMAYAQASGVPPVHGLYATIVPLLVYALLGPSRILVLGPDSTLAPLIAATVLPLAAGDPGRAVALAGAVAVGSGVISIAAGLARFGFVTELISTPVRYGYLNGIVVVVWASQLPRMLGIDLDADRSLARASELVRAIAGGEVNGPAFAIGGASFVVILLLRRVSRRIPAVLVAVVASMVAVRIFGLDDDLVLVGRLPEGLPSFAWPEIRRDDIAPVVAGSFTIALIAFTDTSLLSRAYSYRSGASVNPNKELFALGAANLATGFTQGFAVSASSSRTPVAESAGARTQLTGVVGAVTIALLLVAAPGLLSTLPEATLAAVVMAAVIDLFEVAGVARLARTRPVEFWLSILAFAGVVVLGVVWGIGLAVVISLLVFVQRAWRPHTTVLVRVDGLKGYHDIERHPEGRVVPGLVLYRFDAPLFFANADAFRDEVLSLVRSASEPVEWVVVTAEPITDIDATADDVLVRLHRELSQLGVELAFAELKGVVRDRLERSGTAAKIGEDLFFRTVGEAVRVYVERTGAPWTDWEDGDAVTDQASE
jgi:high affinity sulfate transporter 1